MKILHIDMDDTICKYTEAYEQAILSNPLIQFPQSQYGFFANLKPVPYLIVSIQTLSEFYDVYILTRPSYKNPLCYLEKRVWIEKHFGLEFCNKLILCPNKALIKGDYLVDDKPWPDFEGTQILYGSKEFPNWATTYMHLMKQAGKEPYAAN